MGEISSVTEPVQIQPPTGEFFDQELLKQNYEIWKSHLEGVLEKRWGKTPYNDDLKRYRQMTPTLPLKHTVDANFIEKDIETGEIPSMRRHGNKAGRTSTYEAQMGLDNYVFLSMPHRSEATGLEVFVPAEEVLWQPGVVVTLKDWALLAELDPDNRKKAYRGMAFSGSDFLELLPYFLLAHFPHYDYSEEKIPYPEQLSKLLPGTHSFHPEVKVPDKVILGDEYKVTVVSTLGIHIPTERAINYSDVERQNLVQFLNLGKEWWGDSILDPETQEQVANLEINKIEGLGEAMLTRVAYDIWKEGGINSGIEGAAASIARKITLSDLLKGDIDLKELSNRIKSKIPSSDTAPVAIAVDTVTFSKKQLENLQERVDHLTPIPNNFRLQEFIGLDGVTLQGVIWDDNHEATFIVGRNNQGDLMVMPTLWFSGEAYKDKMVKVRVKVAASDARVGDTLELLSSIGLSNQELIKKIRLLVNRIIKREDDALREAEYQYYQSQQQGTSPTADEGIRVGW